MSEVRGSGAPAQAGDRLGRWLPLLECPLCAGGLGRGDEELRCLGCGHRYPVLDGRPVLREDASDARLMPADHISNQLSPEVASLVRGAGGPVLNLGAGGTRERIDNCIEFEYSIFRHTDVAGDAHRLPFADGSFEAVVSFNTFEHLSDPPRAASEIYRVLKPGGRLVLQTAFLQPVHEPPHHYYNTTEFGLRRWFEGFEIGRVEVTDNFNPAYVLAWVSAALRWHVGAELGAEAAAAFGATTLDEWRAIWEDASRYSGAGWGILQRLSQDSQKCFAAGLHLEATKPARAA